MSIGLSYLLLISLLVNRHNYLPGKYVACIYDNDWLVGNTVEQSEENNDVLVNFMTKNPFTWPRKHDLCWVPFHHALCCIEAPRSPGHEGCQYLYSEHDSQNIQALSAMQK